MRRRAHRREPGQPPLVRMADQPDLAIGARKASRPLDRVVTVLDIGAVVAEVRDVAARLAATPRELPHVDVAARSPPASGGGVRGAVWRALHDDAEGSLPH